MFLPYYCSEVHIVIVHIFHIINDIVLILLNLISNYIYFHESCFYRLFLDTNNQNMIITLHLFYYQTIEMQYIHSLFILLFT